MKEEVKDGRAPMLIYLILVLPMNFSLMESLFFNQNVGLGLQRSIPLGIGCICNDISEGIKPDNFELLKDIEAYAYSNIQIVPMEV